jgi:DNA invertase Pin-like site-specific DNA recombinase
MLDQLREGDIVAVWKLDRLARSTRNLLEIVETIGNAGARFQSISEPWADTTTHAGKMIMTIFAGIADAQKRGVRFGRPKKMNAEQRDVAQRLLKEGKSVREVAQSRNRTDGLPKTSNMNKLLTADAAQSIPNRCDHHPGGGYIDAAG